MIFEVYEAGIETIILTVVFVASAAVAFSGYQKAKKQAQNAIDAQKGLLYQVRNPVMPRRIIYGQQRVGGIEAYVASSGVSNEFIHYIFIWSDGPNQATSSILFKGIPVTWSAPVDGVYTSTGDYAGLVLREDRLGDAGQTAIQPAVGIPGWVATDTMDKLAHTWIRLEFNEAAFPNGVPNIGAICLGRNDVYDPRLSANVHTDNVALCCNHYLTTSQLGPGFDFGKEINEDSLLIAADDCAFPITISTGGTENRYTFNGVVTLDRDTEEIIGDFRTAMAGSIVYISGRWFFYAGIFVVPTFTITEAMLIAPVLGRSRPSKKDHFNTVRGVFAAESTSWQPTDFPAYSLLTFEIVDSNWLAVEWSPKLSLFCAVSSGQSGNPDADLVMTSEDGEVWVARTPATEDDWEDVAWSPELGIFCAVSSIGNNRVMTSPNGKDWTSHVASINDAWSGIAWSPELSLFCAVAVSGSSNRVMTSPNGKDWTTRIAASPTGWNTITWSPELSLFCAGSISGSSSFDRIMTSPDGITWTPRTTLTEPVCLDIVWSPEESLFCIVSGTIDKVFISSDGINWTVSVTPLGTVRAVTWSPELLLFCIVLGNASSVGSMTSPDGVTWTLGIDGPGNWRSVTWSPKLLILCATGGSSGVSSAMTSLDGKNWILQTKTSSGKEELAADLELLHTNSFTRCRRIAKIHLLRSQFSRSVTIQCNIEGRRVIPGRPAFLNFPSLGFNNTPMDVLFTGLTVQDNRIRIDIELRETSSTIFDWDPDTEDLAGTEPGIIIPEVIPPDLGFGADPEASVGNLLYTDI